ncbi:mitochondrial 16S rRNA m3U1498 methyltransferase RsmE [Andalucia godoyi]|uniref:16S rRNA (uracil(1498)-N(3))-methyltransferase n=1 Tax=Andalucia godoyi TaxID=505711 RepID=A0A8K0AJU2_ANDGO|nr:mitochondrial 16S rRNA m3U1498 methyltransferase RsmE [Andalucia godoyi]|eukprot:ANDGO_08081.mRNA.1 mitochondrial 16S rRNA m3U1498 methyltransferase RsmE
MHRLYYGCARLQSDLKQRVITLCQAESRHGFGVLRLKPDDTIEVFDGRGASATGRIVSILDPRHPFFGKEQGTKQGRDAMSVELMSDVTIDKKPVFSIRALTALPRFQSRADWMLEKLVEVGVDFISPVLRSDHAGSRRYESHDHGDSDAVEGWSEKKSHRVLQLFVAACKQAERNTIPEVRPAPSFSEAVEDSATRGPVLCCHVADQAPALWTRLASPSFSKDAFRTERWDSVSVLVGPEGGFSAREVDVFSRIPNVKFVSLGSTKLRTETAAVLVSGILSQWRGSFS